MRGLAFCAVLLVVTACNRGPTLSVKNAPPPQLEEGWKTLTTKDGAASMSIPSYWRSATDRVSSSEAFGGMFEQMEGRMPTEGETEVAMSGVGEEMRNEAAEADKEVEEARMKEWAKKGILLMAYNNARPIPGEPRTSIILRRIPGEGRGTLEQAIGKAKESVSGDPEISTVDLPIGQAGQIKVKYQSMSGDEICEIRYVMLDGGDLYRLEFITSNGMQQIEDIARPVADTVRIRPKSG